MIRLIFRVVSKGGRYEYHTAEVVGEKAALLVGNEPAEVVGCEFCTSLDERAAEYNRLFEGYNPRSVMDDIRARSNKDSCDTVPVGATKEFHSRSCDPSLLNPEHAEIPREVREQIFDAIPLVNEASVDTAPKFSADPFMELWLLLNTKTGKFVETTTTEGGLAYISCPNEQEAKKVAEQQRIYDIDSKPMRVL